MQVKHYSKEVSQSKGEQHPEVIVHAAATVPQEGVTTQTLFVQEVPVLQQSLVKVQPEPVQAVKVYLLRPI